MLTVKAEPGARIAKLIGGVMRPANVNIRNVARRHAMGHATAEDLAAGFRAASEVVEFVEAFAAAWNSRFPEVPSSTKDTVLRPYRRYELRFWQTSPEFLRRG